MAGLEARRRSNIDAMYAVLETCCSSAKISHILLRANLSHQQLRKYLTILVDYGLLGSSENKFQTTEKGRLFMVRYEELVRILGEKGTSKSKE